MQRLEQFRDIPAAIVEQDPQPRIEAAGRAMGALEMLLAAADAAAEPPGLARAGRADDDTAPIEMTKDPGLSAARAGRGVPAEPGVAGVADLPSE